MKVVKGGWLRSETNNLGWESGQCKGPEETMEMSCQGEGWKEYKAQ